MFYDETTQTVRVGRILTVIFAFLLVAVVGGFVIDNWVTAYNNNVTQPLRRQQLNHDADWERAQMAHERALQADYLTAVARMTPDHDTLAAMVASAGPVRDWTTLTQQQYQQLVLAYQGDYQAAVREANDYNALHDNPDTTITPWPSDLPTHIGPPPAENMVFPTN